MSDCKYKEYDIIVAKTLEYFLSLNDKEFKIDYFDEDDIIDLYLFRIMFMSQMYRSRPILLNMNIYHYIKFKLQNYKYHINFKKITNKNKTCNDSSFHLLKILAKEQKDNMTDLINLEEKVKEIYNEYYK